MGNDDLTKPVTPPPASDEATPTRDELLAELADCRDLATAASGHDDSAAIADPLQVAAHVGLALGIPPEYRRSVTPPPASDEADDVVMVPKQLLFDLWRYGNIHTVDGVIYSKPHRERLREADAILLAPKSLRPSPTRDETIEMCAKWHDEQAEEWEKIATIAAAKKDAVELQRANERVLWHVADAQNIRALKSTPDAEGE